MATANDKLGISENEFAPSVVDKLLRKRANKKGQDVITDIQNKWIAGSVSRNSAFRNRGLMEQYLFPFVNTKGLKESDRVYQSQKYIDLNMVMINSICALASDIPIDIMLSALRSNKELDAKIYEKGISYIKRKNNHSELRRKMQIHSIVNGTGVYKISVEQKTDGKNPFIKLDSIDPCMVACDPIASNNNEIRWVIEIGTYTKSYLKNKYKQKFDDSDDGVTQLNSEILQEYNLSEYNNDSKGVNVYECWEASDSDPEGRSVIYTVCTDTQILERRAFNLACGIPYVFTPYQLCADRVFGLGLYEKLFPISDEMNELMNRISLILERCSNPKCIVNMSSGIDPFSMDNGIGGIIPVPKAMDLTQAIRWEYGAQLNPEFMQYAKSMEYWAQTVAGINDVSLGRGEINSGMPSGKSLETMSENAQTRIRDWVRNIKEGERILGIKLTELINDVMTEDEQIKITGESAQDLMKVLSAEKLDTIQYLKEEGAVTDEDFKTGLMVADKDRGVTLQKAKDGNAYFSFNGSRLGEPTDFDVEVKSGMDVKYNRLDIANAAVQMLMGGKIDFATYLDLINFPEEKKKMLIEREAANQQKAMAMQAQMAGGGQVPPEAVPLPSEEATPTKAIEGPAAPDTGAVMNPEVQ